MVLDCVIRINIIISLPGNLEEFFFRHDLPNAIHKELQYIKLFRSQAKILSIQESLPQVQVDFQADVGDLIIAYSLVLALRYRRIRAEAWARKAVPDPVVLLRGGRRPLRHSAPRFPPAWNSR